MTNDTLLPPTPLQVGMVKQKSLFPIQTKLVINAQSNVEVPAEVIVNIDQPTSSVDLSETEI